MAGQILHIFCWLLVLWSFGYADPFAEYKRGGCDRRFIVEKLARACAYHKRGIELTSSQDGGGGQLIQAFPPDPIQELSRFYFRTRFTPDSKQAHFPDLRMSYFITALFDMHDPVPSVPAPRFMYPGPTYPPFLSQTPLQELPSRRLSYPYYNLNPIVAGPIQQGPATFGRLEPGFDDSPSTEDDVDYFRRWTRLTRDPVLQALMAKCCGAGCQQADFVQASRERNMCGK